MVTIAILSVLIAAIVPTMTHIRRRSLATAIGNDLRVFATAFEAYAHETGNWPAESDPGALPPEMASRVSLPSWQRQTAMGGRYNWDNNQMHYGVRYKAVIAISSVSNSAVIQDLDLFEAIDRVLDDGVLTTGSFRLGSDDEPILIVAP